MKEKFPKICLYLGISCSLFCSPSFSQSIKRQSIGSGGNEVYSDGMIIHQSVGQSYSTQTNYENGIGFMPGFQQANSLQIEALENTINLSVFPNPTSLSFTLESTEPLNDISLEVFNAEGKSILSEKLNSLSKHTIVCDSWQKGVYFIKVYDKMNKNYSSKISIIK